MCSSPGSRFLSSLASVFVLVAVGTWPVPVRAQIVPDCGNGILEDPEACDDGNQVDGDCCSANCTIEPSTTQCRAAPSFCDVVEFCTGVDPNCPDDSFASPGVVCRPSQGDCDLSEFCTGTSPTCPSNVLVPNRTVCRPAVDVCDKAEECDGVSAWLNKILKRPAFEKTMAKVKA